MAEEDAPTQRMPPPPDMWGARQANTARASGQETSPVYAPPNYFQQPPPPIQPYTPPRSRPVWPWIVGAIGSILLVAMILGVILSNSGNGGGGRPRGRPRGPGAPPQASVPTDIPAVPGIPAPPLPPLAPLPPGAESVLGADNAEVDASDGEIVLTKRFTLDKSASVTLANVSGDIAIEASDGPEAELIVSKSGGSEQDREAAQVKFFSDNGRLSVRADIPRNVKNVDVRYELRLPRELGRVEVNSTSGNIRMSDIAAQIAIATLSGEIELSDVTGVATARTVSGNIKAELAQVPPDRPMDFVSVSGNIEVNFNSDFDANLTAATTSGSIRLDDDFGITVQKPLVGQHASGRIGRGGPPLSVKTVSGNIKLTK